MASDVTGYKRYNSEELLRIINSKRQFSPLIDALCARLEEALATTIDLGIHTKVCPICGGTIKVEVGETDVSISSYIPQE